MSLVDYASSSDDEEDAAVLGVDNNDPNIEAATVSPPDRLPPPPPQTAPPHVASNVNQSRVPMSSVNGKTETVSHLASSSIKKLPDASILLNSPMSSHPVNSTSHSSPVAPSYSQSSLGKREGNGSISSDIRTKMPRGSLPHLRNILDTGTGDNKMVPPQLRGRSNVVTEDMGNLFVRSKAEGSHSGV
ncbi:hypothetical protein AKJ16_DCAP04479 [Drosera capensis]